MRRLIHFEDENPAELIQLDQRRIVEVVLPHLGKEFRCGRLFDRFHPGHSRVGGSRDAFRFGEGIAVLALSCATARAITCSRSGATAKKLRTRATKASRSFAWG